MGCIIFHYRYIALTLNIIFVPILVLLLAIFRKAVGGGECRTP